MANSYMQFIKETFDNPESLNMEQIHKLIAETNTYFESLQNLMQTGDQSAKEAAVAAALEVKGYLDAKASLAAELDLTPEDLNDEQRQLVATLTGGLKIVGSGQKKVNKTKKIKQTKLR